MQRPGQVRSKILLYHSCDQGHLGLIFSPDSVARAQHLIPWPVIICFQSLKHCNSKRLARLPTDLLENSRTHALFAIHFLATYNPRIKEEIARKVVAYDLFGHSLLFNLTCLANNGMRNNVSVENTSIEYCHRLWYSGVFRRPENEEP